MIPKQISQLESMIAIIGMLAIAFLLYLGIIDWKIIAVGLILLIRSILRIATGRFWGKNGK